MEKLRLCFWPTTMQGDIYALAHHYQPQIARGEVEVLIAVDDADDWRREPVNQLLPIDAELVERTKSSHLKRIKDFDPHFLFVDNHLPDKRVFRNLVHLWHGFGWKALRADVEFSGAIRNLEKLVGRVDQPNPGFVFQCYGEFERGRRIEETRIHADNCRIMGMLYADMLMNPPVTRAQIAPFYPFGDASRKTVLLGFTWGFGEVFQSWDVPEHELMERVLGYLTERQCNVILRMHDRRRYDKRYLEMLEGVARDFGNVLVKYKDVGRDNLFDVLLADVIVSNFSGIVVYASFTGAAPLHIHPMGDRGGEHALYKVRWSRPVVDKRATYLWKMPPEENGGLLAHRESELIEHLGMALDQPGLCADRSRAFVQKYMETTDGHTCERLDAFLKEWHRRGGKPPMDWQAV